MTTLQDAPATTPAAPKKVKRYSTKPRKSITLTLATGVILLYSVVPLLWLVINATKSREGLTDSFGLWFADGEFLLWDNIVSTLTYDDGIFGRWFLNTLLYVLAGAGGATFLAVLGGYGLAKFNFPGRVASSRS